MVVAAIALTVVVLPLPPTAAHAHQFVGAYEFIVGWTGEPPFVGVQNGLDLGIKKTVDNVTTWVEGAHSGLTATLTTGTASVTKAIEPQFGQPGWYTFDVIPTKEGNYTVRIFGTLESTPIDFTIGLEDVSQRADVEFPIVDPTPQELRTENTALRTQVTSLQGQVGLLTAIAALGVVVALLGLGATVMVGRRMRRAP